MLLVRGKPWLFTLLLVFRQNRRPLVMARNIITIVNLLFLHFIVKCHSGTASRTMTPAWSVEGNLTAHSATHNGSLYSLCCTSGLHPYNTTQQSRGYSNQPETVTQMRMFASNTSVVKVRKEMKINTLSENTNRSDRPSHLYLGFENCANRIVRYRVIGAHSIITWYFDANFFFQLLCRGHCVLRPRFECFTRISGCRLLQHEFCKVCSC